MQKGYQERIGGKEGEIEKNQRQEHRSPYEHPAESAHRAEFQNAIRRNGKGEKGPEVDLNEDSFGDAAGSVMEAGDNRSSSISEAEICQAVQSGPGNDKTEPAWNGARSSGR